ncbi:MAG: hypothetical protein ACP5LK_02435 [Candidatus Bipolaricaulaceae bacterium]
MWAIVPRRVVQKASGAAIALAGIVILLGPTIPGLWWLAFHQGLAFPFIAFGLTLLSGGFAQGAQERTQESLVPPIVVVMLGFTILFLNFFVPVPWRTHTEVDPVWPMLLVALGTGRLTAMLRARRKTFQDC